MSQSIPPSLRLKVEYRSLASLTPYKGNARSHPPAQLKMIARSIGTIGFVVPLIIDENGMILCGHGRYEAAKLAGMNEVPTIMLDHLSEADRKAYILFDNAIAEQSGWNRKLVRTELQGLVDLGYDVELTGFSSLTIDTLLNIGETVADDREPPVEIPDEEAPPISRLGDLWEIGPHRLLCGDARIAANYERLLAGQSAQMSITDPPYNVKIAGNVSGLGSTKHGEFVMGSGEMTDNEFELQLLRPTFKQIAKHSDAGAIAFVFMDWRGGRILQDAAEGLFHELKNIATWVKPNAGMGTFYRSQSEFVFIYKVSPGAHINNFGLGGGGRHRTNVWNYPGATSFRPGRKQDLADHPTVKNRRMIADVILDCSKQGGIVLDPFLGSGTTLVAAQMTGRRGYGMELDPKYCDVTLRRIQAEAGLTATLGDRTFEQIAAERSQEADHG